MALEERSRWATRIQIDPVQQSVTIWRDLVYGLNPSMVESEHGLMIPDEGGIQQVAVFDRSITLGDMEIRVVLHSFGPQAAYHDRPPASTEIVLWVNGQARVAGFLEGSEFGADGTPVWDRLSIYRLGGVLVASAVMGDYPLVRRGVSNGNLSTENPWLMEPRGSFPSLEDINRFLQEDDDEASPTSLPATSTVARRKPLPS